VYLEPKEDKRCGVDVSGGPDVPHFDDNPDEVTHDGNKLVPVPKSLKVLGPYVGPQTVNLANLRKDFSLISPDLTQFKLRGSNRGIDLVSTFSTSTRKQTDSDFEGGPLPACDDPWMGGC
jgi:hypothetical protein